MGGFAKCKGSDYWQSLSELLKTHTVPLTYTYLKRDELIMNQR